MFFKFYKNLVFFKKKKKITKGTYAGDLDFEGERDRPLLSLEVARTFDEELDDRLPLELRDLDRDPELEREPDGVREGVRDRRFVRLGLLSLLVVVGDATDATTGVAILLLVLLFNLGVVAAASLSSLYCSPTGYLCCSKCCRVL